MRLEALLKGFLWVVAGLIAGGCSHLGDAEIPAEDALTRIAIHDELLPPNFAILPQEVTIKAGEQVAWVNHTRTAMELTFERPGDDGLLGKLGSKLEGLSGREAREAPEADGRVEELQEALRLQQEELARLREQLARGSGPQQEDLVRRFEALEQRMQSLEAQAERLESGPGGSAQAPEESSKDQEASRQPAVISPLGTVKRRFDHPGLYRFTLFDTSAVRHTGRVRGSVRVLP